MKRVASILSFALLSSYLISCGGTEEKKDAKKKDEPKEDVDTTSADTLVEEEVIKYELLEDYVALSSPELASAYFGDSNMVADTNWYAEGEVMMLSHRCTDPHNGNIIYLVWEEGGKEKLAQIEAFHKVYDSGFPNILKSQKVRTKCGLSTGMSIDELEAFSGQPVEFSGFAWDFGGGVFLNGNTKLEACNVSLTLDLDMSDHSKVEHLLGDIGLKSNQDGVKGQPIYVQKLAYYLR